MSNTWFNKDWFFKQKNIDIDDFIKKNPHISRSEIEIIKNEMDESKKCVAEDKEHRHKLYNTNCSNECESNCDRCEQIADDGGYNSKGDSDNARVFASNKKKKGKENSESV